jgi:histidine phosphotransferase ChpT
MMNKRVDVTALVGSRICHDLISPLGAIGNGVELLELSGLPQSPEMALIAESVESANARIRFFRVAYGSALVDQMMTRAEIASTLTAAARGGRLSYFWAAEGDQPRAEVRAVFLLLQCFETALPLGGEIQIDRRGADWELSAESDRLRLDEPLWTSMLQTRIKPQVSASQVQFLLLPDVLSDLGRNLALKLGPDRITARF